MGDGSQVVVDVVRRAEFVVVPAVAGQFLVLVDEEVADVEVLVGGEAVAALEEEVGGVVVPRTAGIDIARPGAVQCEDRS